MFSRPKPLAALVASAVSLCSVAQGDQGVLSPVHVVESAEQGETRDYQPLTSQVGGKTEAAILDTPQSVTVVNKALMEAQGATSLADTLKNVPGITLGGAEGGQIGNNFNLRGFSARSDIYLDGFRDRGQYYRDTFNLEQVEVLQGSSSMLFGRGSTGGVINQVSKQARLDELQNVSAMLGSDGRLRTTFDTNSRLSDTAAMRLNVFAQRLQTTRDEMENKDFGVAPSARFGIGTTTEIEVSGLLQHNNDMPDYGVLSLNGRPMTPSRETFYGLASDHTDQDIQMLSATVKHEFDEHLSLRNRTQLNHYTTEVRETAARAFGNTNGSTITALPSPAFGDYAPNQLWVQLRSLDRSIKDTSLDNQTDMISRFQTGSIQHELIIGFELGHDTYRNQSFSRTGAGAGGTGNVAWVPFLDPSHEDPSTVTVTKGNLAQSEANSLGAYLNDTLSFGEQWKLVTGIRRDSFRGNITNSINAPTGRTDISAGFTSLREGLLYQPSTRQSYYLSYGTSFNPLLENMTLTNGTQQLPPTDTRTYEVGSKYLLLGERLSLSAAYFDELQQHVYSKDSSGIYQPVGNWRIKGYSFSAAGRLTSRWQVSGGYLHLNPRIVNTLDATNGSIPANTPKDSLSLWTSFDLNRHWELGGGANYLSKRFVANTPTNVNKVSVPSYLRWDATLAYHQAHYDVRLNLLNVTNSDYYDALISSDGGRAVPGIGRTLLLSSSYRF